MTKKTNTNSNSNPIATETATICTMSAAKIAATYDGNAAKKKALAALGVTNEDYKAYTAAVELVADSVYSVYIADFNADTTEHKKAENAAFAALKRLLNFFSDARDGLKVRPQAGDIRALIPLVVNVGMEYKANAEGTDVEKTGRRIAKMRGLSTIRANIESFIVDRINDAKAQSIDEYKEARKAEKAARAAKRAAEKAKELEETSKAIESKKAA